MKKLRIDKIKCPAIKEPELDLEDSFALPESQQHPTSFLRDVKTQLTVCLNYESLIS